jgi:adenosylhomocysteine nucleosidase
MTQARTAILAALPRELAPLVKDWPVQSVSRSDGARIAECDRAVAVCAGMGAARVALAMELAQSRGPLDMIISAGYAGALRMETAAGTVFWPSLVIDAYTGERHTCGRGTGTLVSIDHVADRQEKRTLVGRWGADLVDMEAASVASMAKERGLPFRALRVVSDEADESLPDLNRFTGPDGSFREAAFAAYIMLHPWLIPSAMRMGRNAARGSQAMARELRIFLERAD